VKLPDKIRSYRASDLSGSIVGTDLDDQRVPLDHRNPLSTRVIRGGSADVVRTGREHLPITDNRVQLLIEVPGAEKLVKDRINIRSRILKERQDLEITF
ncbi:MAG: hypothetical protein KY476_25700, partial [Planctomycetes bacterium]|nr:hypothetical protein [Planctomycetota bacterium]